MARPICGDVRDDRPGARRLDRFPRKRSSSSPTCRGRAGAQARTPGTRRTAWTAILARLGARRPRSVVIDLGKEGSQNRAITDLRVEAPVVTAGSTVMVRGVIHNFGPSRADGVSVRLNVDDRVGPEQAVDLPVGEDVPVIFNQQFTAARRSCRRDLDG